MNLTNSYTVNEALNLVDRAASKDPWWLFLAMLLLVLISSFYLIKYSFNKRDEVIEKLRAADSDRITLMREFHTEVTRYQTEFAARLEAITKESIAVNHHVATAIERFERVIEPRQPPPRSG